MKRRSKKNVTLAQWISIFKGGRKFYRLSDLMKLGGLGVDATRKAAQRLVSQGILSKLYCEFFGNRLQTYQTEEVAGIIYPPSYISCETALFHHSIIDQAPMSVVSVSTRKSKRIQIGEGGLIYHKVHPSLFWGYARVDGYLLAEPEKALLDWIYLSARKNFRPPLDELNREHLDLKKLKRYAARFPLFVRRRLP